MLCNLFGHWVFLIRRLIRYALAEIIYVLGNFVPRRLAPTFWNTVLALNPHHVPAALNRALALQTVNDANAWLAFQDALRAIENPQHTSASDVALTWVPGRLMRRIVQRILWRDVPADYIMGMHDHWQQDALVRLAQAHFTKALAMRDWARARIALDVWQRTQPSLASEWANVELEFQSGNLSLAAQCATPLIESGNFVAPLDALVWAEHWLASDALDLAERCLRWAERWTPELACAWTLRGRLVSRRSNADDARRVFERALALDPEDIDTFLALQALMYATPISKSPSVRLRVDAPASMRVSEQAQLMCRIDGASDGWEIHILPPAGWGIIAMPRHQSVDAKCRCVFTLRACRPHRIRGEAWTLNIVAVNAPSPFQGEGRGEGSYTTTQIRITIPDDQPGQVLVVSTEDHEIWEERGTLSTDDLRRLFIDKSNMTAQRFHPLTQMIEVGSTLAMLDRAAEHDDSWRALRDDVRAALVQNVTDGGDLQPHLHAFNDPRSSEFPYRVASDGWTIDYKFLLTAEERRRDFAQAFAPQERIERVADTVAQVERIGRLGDQNYRAVLWRTGQLEFGVDANDRAWSAVALLRAGLLADTDLRGASSAFLADVADPFAPSIGGVLIQLPIWSNLEGNYLTDARALKRRVQATFARLRRNDGAPEPGVHLFTLLTHDKFINARRGGDEFRLDEEYGDWVTMREHVDAWKREGATFVTAREGIARLIDDSAWRLTPMLGEEKFIADNQVRYTIRLLGQSIPVSADYPHHVLVSIPPFLRDRVLSVRVCQSDQILPIEWNRADCFWVIVTSTDSPIQCNFDLRAPTNE